YESSTFKQGHTTAADIVGLHNLNILAADTANGFPQGDNPLIEMKFKVIGPGYTPIVMKVASLHDTTGADILAKAVVKNGAVTATGTAPPKTTGTTPATVTTTVPGVTVVTPITTLTPITIATTSAVVNPVRAVPVTSGPATVPFNTGVFSITSIGNVPVGAIGTVQLVVDNAWEPNFADTYVDITYDPTMIKYTSSSIDVGNTTAASKSDGMIRVMLGDFRHGYPQGKYPIADITFTALREGTTPLTVSVDHVRYWNSDFTRFTDISTTASTQSGSFSTGPIQAAATLAPVTPNPAVTYETVVPIGTVPTVVAPVSVDSNPVSAGSVNRDSDEYTGVVTKTVTPTPTKTSAPVATEVPVTVITTAPTVSTPAPTTVATVATTVPTMIKTTQPATPTATKSALPFGALALAALAGVALVMARARR
ncbi:MAG: hypothetical protein ABFC89_10225, partial [Methanospirillum sp.]